MTAAYQHPSLNMTVTPEQRDRAESWLKDAYAEGRVSESEFDRRIGQVLSADNRKELNEAFYGLVNVPSASTAIGAPDSARRLRASTIFSRAPARPASSRMMASARATARA